MTYSEIETKIHELLPHTNKNILLILPDFTRQHTSVEQILFRQLRDRYNGHLDIAIANGMHRQMAMSEISCKVAGDISDCMVYQNHPFQEDEWLENLKKERNYYVISYSTPLPHNHAGMSGGSKLILPGLSHWSDVNGYHKQDPCAAVSKSQAVAQKIVDFQVAASLDGDRGVLDLYVGKQGWNYDDWVSRSRDYYKVQLTDDLPDVAILEPKIKNTDFQQSMNAMLICQNYHIVKKGGTIIIMSPCRDGMGTHYLFQQPHGKTPVKYDMLFSRIIGKRSTRDIHFCMPTIPERAIREYFVYQKPMNFKEYGDAIGFMESRHGKNARLIHYTAPDITIGEQI